ncbi:MAG: amidase [Deltaproteobacteria bacterium]|nr:amidase [Deltaproteobacteria bacterium]
MREEDETEGIIPNSQMARPGGIMDLMNDEHLTIAQVAPLIQKRKISPVELTDALLARIQRFQPALNAFITITGDLAREQARKAEKEIVKGEYRGALHGIPISLKDLFYTAGIRTTAGSKILRNFVPTENAAVVDRLLSAGAVLLGKTNLHEFAYGCTNINPHYGPVRNPWDPSRVPGGSSGGSAVSVCAGLSLASLGTDTGGSIRIPAAACGVVGLKPSYGLVPLHGVIPLAFSLDHAGPICRCVEDAAILLGVIAGYDPRDHSSLQAEVRVSLRNREKGIRGLRVGVPKQYFYDRLQNDVRRALLAAHRVFEKLGAQVRPVDLKDMNETASLAGEITVAEATSYHWDWLQKRPGDYGPDVRTRMKQGEKQLTLTYLQAQKKRQAYADTFRKALETVDLLAVPTLPVVAPPIDAEEVRMGRFTENVRTALLRFTRPGNLTGLPAISIPCGFSSENLPIGLQLIGRFLEEETVLQAAHAYEQATAWHTLFPSEQNSFQAALPAEPPKAVRSPGRRVPL